MKKVKFSIKKIFITCFLTFTIGISLSFKSDFFEVAKQIDIYTTLFKELNMYYIDEVNPAELTEVAIDNMLKSLDPYTNFYDEQGVIDAKIHNKGEYGGIGTITSYKDGFLVFQKVHKGMPADKAGLKAGDKVVQIDEIKLNEIPAAEVQTLLKGTPKTQVHLVVERQGKKMEFDVTREKIEIHAVPFYKMIDDKIGYIVFTKFNEKASKEVKAAYTELMEQGMEKLIIDVRGNPGGLLHEAVNIANFFLPKGEVIVTTKAKVKKWSDTYKTTKQPLDLQIPIAILVDNRSASASEILAGSLQDYDRGVVIGQRSFGKGLVQRFRKLSYGTQMKLTISKYYTPSGRCIQELDYANMDKDGNVPKFSDNGVNSFKTKNGRTVYDGGGVAPDIKVGERIDSDMMEGLIHSEAMFNFVTDYYYKNQNLQNPMDFKISKNDFVALKDYLIEKDTTFRTPADVAFAEALEISSEDDLSKGISKEYKALRTKLKKETVDKFDDFQDRIQDKMEDFIIERYIYQDGVYEHKIKYDEVIQEAVKTLNDSKKYEDILK
ncbi:S41 family peptidase [Aureivirga sp. CE67]|uniref:S41 family peptidase n=1 Tax=Aureivirga sp. CE67 TaxID=1788983 RepID=UPI0018CAAF07|nr:S41 family peptidase [Aureivirga sp. CE67]